MEFYDKLQHEAEQRKRKRSNKKTHRSKLFREFGNKPWQERLPVKAKKKKNITFCILNLFVDYILKGQRWIKIFHQWFCLFRQHRVFWRPAKWLMQEVFVHFLREYIFEEKIFWRPAKGLMQEVFAIFEENIFFGGEYILTAY